MNVRKNGEVIMLTMEITCEYGAECLTRVALPYECSETSNGRLSLMSFEMITSVRSFLSKDFLMKFYCLQNYDYIVIIR